jgi:hypothetical protein
MLFEEYLDDEEYLEELNELLFDFIDSLDFETLSEDQADKLDDLLEFITDNEIEDDEDSEEELEEAIKKRVVRKGKIIRKLICKPG